MKFLSYKKISFYININVLQVFSFETSNLMKKMISNTILFLLSHHSPQQLVFTSIVDMHYQSSNNMNNNAVLSWFYWCFYSTRLIKVLTCFSLNAIFVRTDLNMLLRNKKWICREDGHCFVLTNYSIFMHSKTTMYKNSSIVSKGHWFLFFI